jgi:FkbM family methyltransferase
MPKINSALGTQDTRFGRPVIVTKPGEKGCALYGPYVDLPCGSYTICFRIVPDHAVSPDVADKHCVSVDICHSNGTKVVAEKKFTVQDIASSGRELKVVFTAERPGCFEFRVFSLGIIGLIIEQNQDIAAETDCFHLFNGSTGPVIYNGFIVNNIKALQRLTGQGAALEWTIDGVKVTISGMTIHLTKPEQFQLIGEILDNNDYAFYMRERVCVIDIGMNVGIASLYFATLPFVEEIHSFEPFKAPFEQALQNFESNPALSTKIRPCNFGLGGKSEDVDVFYDPSSTIGVSIRGSARGEKVTIAIRDVAAEVKEIIANANRKKLKIVIKMDCEGSEFAILDRLEEEGLLDGISLFMVEWHKWWSPEKTQQTIIDQLLRHNFIVLDRTHLSNPHAGLLNALRVTA